MRSGGKLSESEQFQIHVNNQRYLRQREREERKRAMIAEASKPPTAKNYAELQRVQQENQGQARKVPSREEQVMVEVTKQTRCIMPERIRTATESMAIKSKEEQLETAASPHPALPCDFASSARTSAVAAQMVAYDEAGASTRTGDHDAHATLANQERGPSGEDCLASAASDQSSGELVASVLPSTAIPASERFLASPAAARVLNHREDELKREIKQLEMAIEIARTRRSRSRARSRGRQSQRGEQSDCVQESVDERLQSIIDETAKKQVARSGRSATSWL